MFVLFENFQCKLHRCELKSKDVRWSTLFFIYFKWLLYSKTISYWFQKNELVHTQAQAFCDFGIFENTGYLLAAKFWMKYGNFSKIYLALFAYGILMNPVTYDQLPRRTVSCKMFSFNRSHLLLYSSSYCSFQRTVIVN